jgi:hypothetical protein
MALAGLAEGEELGSNLLRVAQSSAAAPGGSSSRNWDGDRKSSARPGNAEVKGGAAIDRDGGSMARPTLIHRREVRENEPGVR